MTASTVRCHVCGLREPENPSVPFPVCHPCRNSLRYRAEKPEAVRRRQKLDAFEALQLAIVDARRACAALDGIESLRPY